MGTSVISNTRQGLSSLRIERSWIVSGTPTKESDDVKVSKKAIRSLFYLVKFMRHPTFFVEDASTGGYCNDEARSMLGARGWGFLIQSAFDKGHPQALSRLSGLLGKLMIRHVKMVSLKNVPPPRRLTKFLKMSPVEAENYNTRASLALTNLALTTRAGGRLEKESLLVAPNRKDMLMQIRFMRLMCAGGGPLTVHLSNENRIMTEVMLSSKPCPNPACTRRLVWRKEVANKPKGFHNCKPMDEKYELCLTHSGFSGFGADESVVRRARGFMNRVVRGSKSVCARCGVKLVLQILTPCGHLVCCECLGKCDELRTRCYACNSSYTFDELQLLQPGFDVDFTETLKESATRRNLAQQRSQGSRPLRPSNAEDHDGVVGGTKSRYIISKLRELRSKKRSPEDPLLKVVIFSQFQRSLNYIGHDLYMQFGPDSFAEHYGPYRSVELQKFKENSSIKWTCDTCDFENVEVDGRCQQLKFSILPHVAPGEVARPRVWVPASKIQGYYLGRRLQLGESVYVHDAECADGGYSGNVTNIKYCGRPRARGTHKKVACDCFVLLLCSDGSHGLDLSYVNHMIMLETVWERGLEKQIVARAYRMGANRRKPLEVECLVMEDTIEHHMFRIHQEESGGPAQMSHRLLRGLRLLRPNKWNAKGHRAVKGKKRKRARIVHFSSLQDEAVSADEGRLSAPRSISKAKSASTSRSISNGHSEASVQLPVTQETNPVFRSAIEAAMAEASGATSHLEFDGTAKEAVIHRMLDPSGHDHLQQYAKPHLERRTKLPLQILATLHPCQAVTP